VRIPVELSTGSERGDAAVSVAAMSIRLRAFLATFDRPVLYYDYASDRELVERVLLASDTVIDEPGRDKLEWVLLDDIGPALKRWWQAHPEALTRRHHALIDAFALRAAYLSMWGDLGKTSR
jgi:hypothetical protein